LTGEYRLLEALPRIEMRADVCDDIFDGFHRRRIGRRCLDEYSEFEGVLESNVRMSVVECFDDGLRKCVFIERSAILDSVSGHGGEMLYTAGGGDTGVDVAAGGGRLCGRGSIH
jgi:hypothetical protein